MLMCGSALMTSSNRPTCTSSPRLRRTRPKAIRLSMTAMGGVLSAVARHTAGGAVDQPRQPVCPQRFEIFLRLHDDTERLVERIGIKRLLAERRQRRNPVERLGNTRRL